MHDAICPLLRWYSDIFVALDSKLKILVFASRKEFSFAYTEIEKEVLPNVGEPKLSDVPLTPSRRTVVPSYVTPPIPVKVHKLAALPRFVEVREFRDVPYTKVELGFG